MASGTTSIRSTCSSSPDNPYQDAIPEYYRWLDEQIGSILELLDNDTILLVVSDHGAQRLDGGFAINEWLIREGLLVLNEYPKNRLRSKS